MYCIAHSDSHINIFVSEHPHRYSTCGNNLSVYVQYAYENKKSKSLHPSPNYASLHILVLLSPPMASFIQSLSCVSQLKKLPLLMMLLTASSFAHIGIPISPTTACNLLDDDLGIHAASEIDSRIATASPFVTSGNVFSTVGTNVGGVLGSTTTPWVRNSAIWTGNLDLSGVAAWQQSYNGYSSTSQHTPTLISPRHFVIASHWGIGIGATVGFVGSDNVIIYRNVMNVTNIGQDMQIGLLDSDVPDTVTYYPMISGSTLKAMLDKYIPTQNYNTPIIGMNQFHQVYAQQLQ